METGTIIPPSAAAKGSAAVRRFRSSPMANSRFISSDTTKKKKVINPSLIQCPVERVKSNGPSCRPICISQNARNCSDQVVLATINAARSEEHTSELQSRENLVCRLLLEKK